MRTLVVAIRLSLPQSLPVLRRRGGYQPLADNAPGFLDLSHKGPEKLRIFCCEKKKEKRKTGIDKTREKEYYNQAERQMDDWRSW